mmetsp:Transcript_79441/g.125423  ORF Transcript_79441/g.125423 Transcript_79441/m.125423 type:complete len:217 (-) Transcript_79441:36-686(-)
MESTTVTVTSTVTSTVSATVSEEASLSTETVVICIVILSCAFSMAGLILRTLLRNRHRLTEDDLEASNFADEERERSSSIASHAEEALEGPLGSKTPEVWTGTVLSEYVSLILALVQSSFDEGAAGVALVGIKPIAADVELWEWLELHQHLKMAIAELRDVQLSEVTFESLGDELNEVTKGGGHAILVYTSGEDLQSAAKARSGCVKIVESNIIPI